VIPGALKNIASNQKIGNLLKVRLDFDGGTMISG
jgi:hypothetical protein